jgi:hypothetical protein
MGATGQTHQNWPFGRDMAIWFHPNLRAKFPSLILAGKREPPFPPKNIAPLHWPNHTLLVMRSIFRTGEVGVIRPNHRVWAIILTPPFEPINLKKWRGILSLGLGLRYNIFFYKGMYGTLFFTWRNVVREAHTRLICFTYTTGYDSCVECKGEPRRN